MSLISSDLLSLPREAPASEGFARRAARAIYTALRAAARRRAIRAARRELMGLSDEMLKDIGISRSEIADATAGGSPRRSAGLA